MNKKIIGSDTLFFQRDNKHGGVLFGKVDNPLKQIFTNKLKNMLAGNIKKKKTQPADLVPATKSNRYYSVKKTKKIKGGFMTNLFFPSGYATATSTLGLYALNESMKKSVNKQSRKKTKKRI
jgi:hypothetical protein